MFYWTLLTLTIGVSSTIGYQYCYECSSKSALCRNSVYDGHYLTRTPCKSVCFYRNEDNRVYRGCFDGWLGGIVRSDYLGCQTQYYLGEKVEWCFCNGTNSAASSDDDEQPCNGNHRDVIADLGRPTPRHTQNHREEEVVEEEEESEEQDGRRREVYSLQSRSKMFLPTMRAPEGRELTLETLREKQEERDDEGSSPGEIYEDVSHSNSGKSSVAVKKAMECYACHDSSPYCQDRVNRPEFVTSSRCRTKCFIRRENDKTYRGCFDGWVSTRVRHDYFGCRTQYYMDKAVRWCFCNEALCNGVGMDDIISIPEGKKATLRSNDKGTGGTARYDAEPTPVVEEGYGAYRMQPQRSYVPSHVDFKVSSEPIRTIVGMCRGHFDGIYADPYDCTRFVHCFNGFTYRRLCPPGTVWNNKTKNCDFPHNTAVSNCIPRQYRPLYSTYRQTSTGSDRQAKPPYDD